MKTRFGANPSSIGRQGISRPNPKRKPDAEKIYTLPINIPKLNMLLISTLDDVYAVDVQESVP